MTESRCTLAPPGWWCSRTPGHDGPCAAHQKWWNMRNWRLRVLR